MTVKPNRGAGWLLVLTVILATAPAFSQTVADELQAGVDAYKAANYESAIAHFKKAVALDPASTKSRLYLGTAYAQLFVPGADSPESINMAEQAIEQFQAALQGTPHLEQKRRALRNIGSLYFNMKKFDEAMAYYRKVTEIDPNDADAYYRMAVIDWTQSYARRMEFCTKLGLTPVQPIEEKAACAQLRGMNQKAVEEGIDNLTLALELVPDYDDAMAYMNLLYRERADFECNDPAAREADLKAADHWVDETLRVKKAKAGNPPTVRTDE